ncbi:MAG: tRNA lysidine(34) synthetase TilS [Holosporales bacterium]|jgi:tRNA(Ile)-lysidine synthase|nr:tRNA lysidine(34) synthetase TilS [Holosporales bacterium]
MIISNSLFFANIPESVQNEKVIAVGLSGGADSLCLTMFLHQYALNYGLELIACFVDHKLRPESSDEILPIISILKKHRIKYEILVWEHLENIGGNIEKKAREARYKLLFNFCKTINCKSLFIAHHKLDQWETFFMRLSRGSGLGGLSCISSMRENDDMKVIRPMLNFSPTDIKETLLERFNIEKYVCDPSNIQPKYERVRWRNAYALISTQYDLDMDNINKTIKRLQLANDFLNELAKSTANEIFQNGYINISKFKALHTELKMRVLNIIIQLCSNRVDIISYSLLERVSNKLCENGFSAINLSGLVLRRDKTKNIKVYKEQRINYIIV